MAKSQKRKRTKKSNIPGQFNIPKTNCTDLDKKVNILKIYTTALGKYIKKSCNEKPMSLNAACSLASARLDNLMTMYKQYAGQLAEMNLWPPVAELETYPTIYMNEFHGPNLFQDTPFQSVELNPESSQSYLMDLITPRTNRGRIVIADDTQLIYEVTDINRQDYAMDITLYMITCLPLINIEPDGKVRPRIDSNLRYVMITYACEFTISASHPTNKTISSTDYDIIVHKEFTPTKIYSMIKPKILGWNRDDCKFWESTIIQSYSDMEFIFKHKENEYACRPFIDCFINTHLLLTSAVRNPMCEKTDNKINLGIEGLSANKQTITIKNMPKNISYTDYNNIKPVSKPSIYLDKQHLTSYDDEDNINVTIKDDVIKFNTQPDMSDDIDKMLKMFAAYDNAYKTAPIHIHNMATVTHKEDSEK